MTVEKVGKGRAVPVGAQVRVFWPLDDAWYGGEIVGHNEKESVNKQGELKVTKLHTVLYHDGVQEDLNFDKEKVQLVSVGAGGGIPPVDGQPPLRVPIVGGPSRGGSYPTRDGARSASRCAARAASSFARCPSWTFTTSTWYPHLETIPGTQNQSGSLRKRGTEAMAANAVVRPGAVRRAPQTPGRVRQGCEHRSVAGESAARRGARPRWAGR